MQPVPDRLNTPALRRLQLRLRPMLLPAGRNHQTRQANGSGHAGSDCPVQAESASVRDSWFAERQGLGTPLSTQELQHGVDAGIISSHILSKEGI
jgi:hypothetical protein